MFGKRQEIRSDLIRNIKEKETKKNFLLGNESF